MRLGKTIPISAVVHPYIQRAELLKCLALRAVMFPSQQSVVLVLCSDVNVFVLQAQWDQTI